MKLTKGGKFNVSNGDLTIEGVDNGTTTAN